MEKIKVLPSDIYNKISAGEVVERPASVVKELVENAIDAGANTVKISISGGGTGSVTVTDDGRGIDKEFVRTAFLPHATSKISEAADLTGIKTLGFRGEALPSIAAVSKVKLVTRTEGEDFACAIYGEGGVLGEVQTVAGNKGTSVTVSELFFNTPARLKFLKKPAGETREITNLVSRLILANPNVSFRYSADGEEIFNSSGKGVEDAFCSVYGKEMLGTAIRVNAVYKRYIIEGYVGSPLYPKSNTTYQTLVVNGRYVVNSNIANAVRVVYKPYLMTRQYPYYLLYLTVPYDEIDVNVHPNKLDVRFTDERGIFSAFYAPIADAVKNEDKQVLSVPEVSFFGKKDEIPEKEFGEAKEELFHEDAAAAIESKTVSDMTDEPYSYVLKEENGNRSELPFSRYSEALRTPLYSVEKLRDTVRSDYSEKVSSDKSVSALYEQTKKSSRQQTSPVQEGLKGKKLVKVGSMFDTYIILQSVEWDEVYLVDQHAAHERLIYDRLCADFEEKKISVQPILVPYIFSVNGREYEALSENLDIIRSFGFDIEPFGGNAFRIDGLPANLGEISPERFVSCLLEGEDSLENYSQFTKEVLARIACRSAIKGGDRLTDAQTESLIEKLSENVSLKCPHGRPLVLRISRSEIEKWFKRIVS